MRLVPQCRDRNEVYEAFRGCPVQVHMFAWKGAYEKYFAWGPPEIVVMYWLNELILCHESFLITTA
jgi:hypothetical protein